jgi:hypothetical protein
MYASATWNKRRSEESIKYIVNDVNIELFD